MFELKKNAVNMVTMKWYMDNLKDKIIMTEKETQLLPNYTEQDLEKVISNIMSNLSINSIAITDKNELVDGYKRISAINSFMNGDIEYNGKVYSELSSEEKELFDTQYTVKIKSAILEEILLVMEFTSEFTEDVTKKISM